MMQILRSHFCDDIGSLSLWNFYTDRRNHRIGEIVYLSDMWQCAFNEVDYFMLSRVDHL